MTVKKIRWNAGLAYAVGLLATDGCLYKDGRHISLVSKDLDQLENFKNALRINNKISPHISSKNSSGKYYRVQFSNVALHRFFNRIGLNSHKTENISQLKVPDRYFSHFLRGHLDGDGCTYSYWDHRWKGSFQFYTCFVSLSRKHLSWILNKTQALFKIDGTIRKSRLRSGKYIYRLEFAKKSSLALVDYLYPKGNKYIFLKRKKFKIEKALSIITKQADVAKLVHAQS